MFRRILFFSTLSVSIAVFGQGTTNQTGVPTVPEPGAVEGNPGTVAVNPGMVNGVINTGGYVTAGPGLNSISTPVTTFSTPQPTAGISMAGRAGISLDSTQSSPGASNLVYTNMEPAYSAAPVNANPVPAGRAINDLGPSYFVGDSSSSGASTAAASLGEVASQFKARRPTQNVRTYTNSDVDRMNGSMNLRGTNINATITPSSTQNANAPESAAVTPVQQAPEMRTAPAPPSGVAQSPFEPRLSASARPSPAIRAEGAQSSAGQGSTPETAPAGNQNPTTPQVNQPQSAQNTNQQSQNRLPATSTLLPLLGLLGLASGSIGLLVRKFRR